MNSFKSGSGNLEFGSDDDDDADAESGPAQTEQQPAEGSSARRDSDENSDVGASASPANAGESDESETSGASEATGASEAADTESTSAETPTYPYFVRRNNVTDERTVRLEAHVREAVASQEATFRNDLATALDADDVSKTDAREFALKFAFEHPEKVAELMREEGFGAI